VSVDYWSYSDERLLTTDLHAAHPSFYRLWAGPLTNPGPDELAAANQRSPSGLRVISSHPDEG
jgi:hypothetical protein